MHPISQQQQRQSPVIFLFSITKISFDSTERVGAVSNLLHPETKEVMAARASGTLGGYIDEQRGAPKQQEQQLLHDIVNNNNNNDENNNNERVGAKAAEEQSRKAEAMLGGGDVENELTAMQQEERNTENRDFPASPSSSLNPSTAEISRALSGNPSDLNSVNIQGDSEVGTSFSWGWVKIYEVPLRLSTSTGG